MCSISTFLKLSRFLNFQLIANHIFVKYKRSEVLGTRKEKTKCTKYKPHFLITEFSGIKSQGQNVPNVFKQLLSVSAPVQSRTGRGLGPALQHGEAWFTCINSLSWHDFHPILSYPLSIHQGRSYLCPLVRPISYL